MSIENTIEEIRDLLTVLEPYDELLKSDYRLDIRSNLENKLNLCEIQQEFGINPGNDYSHYIKVTDHSAIATWSETMSIASSDDGRQPYIGERLYVVSFPCGAYTLNDGYPQESFGEFISKLKSFGPKYSDKANKSFYYTSDVTKDVHNSLLKLLEDARIAGQEEVRKGKIKKLESEIEKLKGVEQ